jgi:hypothetical protein
MKKNERLFTVAMIFLFAMSTFAQEEEEKWRSFEVTVTGGITNPVGSLSDWKDTLGASLGFHFGGGAGYYFNDNFCTGVYFTYTQMDTEGDWGTSFRMYDLGAYGKYAFTGESSFEPYLKFTTGINSVKFPTWVTLDQNRLREQSYDPGISAAFYGGVLYYTSDYGGLFLEAGLHYDPLKNAEANYHGELYTIGSNISYVEIRGGVTVFFGPEE